AGSKGYVSKADTPRAIRQAILDVLSGKLAYSEDLKELMLTDLCRMGNKREDRFALLTDRELEVFYQLGLGETTRGIAHKLHLSIKTVETYRERIKQKLNLSNANQLMQQATIWVHSCNGLPDKN
ncbi:MAG: response regulator transcription factor, partial [Candidatus Cloacimonetes bacterium]|nr:response regulator transcription factor [Candidatus Cloacimonadota bacterium]